jgi:hypothetical protein
VIYTVGKNKFEGYKILPSHSKKKLIWKRYEHPKFWDNKSSSFGTPTWGPKEKWHLNVVSLERHIVYYMERSDASS